MDLELEPESSIYFIGIGGIAMSATAGIAKSKGYIVRGSDSHAAYSPSKDVLEKYEIPYFLGYDVQHVEQHPSDVYIVSAGEGPQNPEVAYLIEKDLPFYSFAQLLYKLAENDVRIVVTGTHGKSTTTALLGSLLKSMDDSSFMAGAVLVEEESNYHAGEGHYFVFEGDEYKSLFDDPTPKFHYYRPDMVVLTNLEYDHPDVYQNLEEIEQEFLHLLDNVPEDGVVIYNGDDANLARLVYKTNRRMFSFGVKESCSFKVNEIKYSPAGTEITVLNAINPVEPKTEVYQTTLFGELNVYNAIAAIATLRVLGFSAEHISVLLPSFKGVKRRFEIVGQPRGIYIVDDYAHHPTAVVQTIAAARSAFPDKRLWVVFEPHTYSRTAALLPELAASFKDVDQVLLAPIYAARESVGNKIIGSEDVLNAVKKENVNTRLVAGKAEVIEILKKEVGPQDMVIVMAVGSFNSLAHELIKSLE